MLIKKKKKTSVDDSVMEWNMYDDNLEFLLIVV
jgi:hypothetical protein